MILGSFSIDDGDGRENVTFEINSRLFKLCRVHSSSLKMSNVGEFPFELISWELHLSLERERETRHCLFTASSIKRAIRHFHLYLTYRT